MPPCDRPACIFAGLAAPFMIGRRTQELEELNGERPFHDLLLFHPQDAHLHLRLRFDKV